MIKRQWVAGVWVTLFLLTLLPWIRVASAMDFGWDLGGAARFADGEIYARDFFTNVPPLSYWLLSFPIRVFGISLLPISIVMYLTWTIFLAGAVRLACLFRDGARRNLWAVLALAPLSLPHFAPFHYYNTLSLALAVWSLCLLLEPRHSSRNFFLAGVLAALAALAKQPVGFMAAALGIGFLLMESNRRWRSIGEYALGTFAITIVLLGTWGQIGQLGEFARIFFVDSASAKLSSSHVWLVAMPRVTWPEPTYSFAAQLMQKSLGVIALLLAYFVWRRGARKEMILPKPALVVLPLLGLTLLCHFAPQFMLQLVEKGRNSVADSVFTVIDEFFIVCVFVSQFARFISTREKKEGQLLAVLVGLHVALRVAHINYGFLMIPLFAPVVFRTALARPAILVLMIATFLFKFPFEGFGPMMPLEFPGTRGLVLNVKAAEPWQAQLKCVSEKVKGKSALFLSWPGAHPLYGALSVPSVVNFHKDQYHPRLERPLFDRWRLRPPEILVDGPFLRASGDSLFDAAEFKNWVSGNYPHVERCADLKIRQWGGSSVSPH